MENKITMSNDDLKKGSWRTYLPVEKSMDSLFVILKGGPGSGAPIGNKNAYKGGSPFLASPETRNAARKTVEWGRNTVMSQYNEMTGVKPENAEDYNSNAVKWYMRGTPQAQQAHMRKMAEIDWMMHYEHLSPIVEHFGGGSEGLQRMTAWLSEAVKNSFRHEMITQQMYGKGYMSSGTPHKLEKYDYHKLPDGARALGQYPSAHAAWRGGQNAVSALARNSDLREADVLGVAQHPLGGYAPVIHYKSILRFKAGNAVPDPTRCQNYDDPDCGKGTGNYEHKKKPLIETPVIRYQDVPEKERQVLSKKFVENKVDAAQIPKNIDDVWQRAKQSPDFQESLQWYPLRNKWANEKAKEFGIKEENMVGLIAALSPQLYWERNERAAEAIGKRLHEDPTIEITEEDAALHYAADKVSKTKRNKALNVIKYNGIDEASQGKSFIGKFKLSELPADVVAYFDKSVTGILKENVTKGIQMYRGADPDKTLGGAKVRSFYNNILNPDDPRFVTIDAHAIRMLIGFNHTDEETSKVLYQHTTSKKVAHYNAYAHMVDVFKQKAKEYNVLPNELQAATWIEWRKEHPVEDRRAQTVAQAANRTDVQRIVHSVVSQSAKKMAAKKAAPKAAKK